MQITRRRRHSLTLLLTALVSALAGGLVMIIPSAALVFSHPASQAAVRHAKKPKHKRKATSHSRVIVRRGPAGPMGPAGPAGLRGPAGPQGAAGPQIAASLQIDWRGLENAGGHESSSTSVPGIGTLTATCSAGVQRLTLTPGSGANRTVLDATVFQGEGTQGVSSNERLSSESTAPVSLALPPNGMITATISVEPIAGDGGQQLAAPASLTLSSEFKLNGLKDEEDDCYIAAQVIQQQ